MTKISVIIPVYNVEKYIERCLTSVFNQTLKDIEIICVNDGSTDNSEQVLNKYKNHSNFKIINQNNSGISVARNKGLEESKGEYIAFLDSDDYLDLDFFEKLYNCAKECNADVVCGGIIRENKRKQKILVSYNNIETTQDVNYKFSLTKSPQYNFVWNKIYKKDFLINKNIKFPIGRIYEDLWFTPDIIEESDILAVVPNVYYHYWKHKNTLIKCDSDKSRSDKLLGYKYLVDKCKKHNIKISELLFKKDFIFLGIKCLRIYEMQATTKFYLFGVIKFLEIRKRI